MKKKKKTNKALRSCEIASVKTDIMKGPWTSTRWWGRETFKINATDVPNLMKCEYNYSRITCIQIKLSQYPTTKHIIIRHWERSREHLGNPRKIDSAHKDDWTISHKKTYELRAVSDSKC